MAANGEKEITMEEFLINNGEDDNRMWTLVDGKIYDLTDFDHPGGREILQDDHDQDRGDEFKSIHSPAAKNLMKKYFIGVLKKEEKADPAKYKKDDGDVKEGSANNKSNSQGSTSLVFYAVPILLLLVVIFAILKFDLLGSSK
jgi:cytochrome b involved in lipid metabolism